MIELLEIFNLVGFSVVSVGTLVGQAKQLRQWFSDSSKECSEYEVNERFVTDGFGATTVEEFERMYGGDRN